MDSVLCSIKSDKERLQEFMYTGIKSDDEVILSARICRGEIEIISPIVLPLSEVTIYVSKESKF